MIGKGFAHNGKQFVAIEARFDGIESRLDRIAPLLLAEQKRESEDLKVRMRRREDALAVRSDKKSRQGMAVFVFPTPVRSTASFLTLYFPAS
jgi:hypothetical protein